MGRGRCGSVFEPRNNTHARPRQYKAYLKSALDGSMPESEWAENEELKQRAEEEDWEFWEFDVERQVLEERFQFWLPRFTAYSVVTLLYTVVEVQLAACAKAACLDRKTGASVIKCW